MYLFALILYFIFMLLIYKKSAIINKYIYVYLSCILYIYIIDSLKNSNKNCNTE